MLFLTVHFLDISASVGRWILRDIILIVSPPASFLEPIFTLTSIAVGIIVFLFVKHHFKPHLKEAYDALLRTMDAIGLGLFTVIGVEASFINDPGANVFLAVFVGVITGVGGGVLRDVLSGNTPYIFVKHFYACASLIGAIFCAVFWSILGSVPSMLIGAIIIIVLRNLAAHYRWSLPKIEE